MITPVTLHSKGFDLTSMTMLSELRMRISLQANGVASGAVFESIWLHVDRADPVVPEGVFFAVDVDVWCAVLVRQLIFFQFILLHAVVDLGFAGIGLALR